jgi:hypothetical protein
MTKSIKKTKQPVLNTTFIYVGLFVFSFILFGNTLWNGYNLDDELVTLNHHLTSKGISAIPEIFASPYYQDNSGYAYEYRPVVLASFAMEHSLFGDSAAVSHFINVLLYAISTMLMLKVLLALFAQYNIILPVIIAFLFAAHPLHTEAVASIKNRDEILALLFVLMAWMISIRYVEKKTWLLVIIAALLFVLAIFAKQSVLSLAILIPASLVFFLKPGFKQTFALSAILALTVFITAPLHNLLYKFLLFGAVMFLPLILQYILSADIAIKNKFASLIRSNKSSNPTSSDAGGIININISRNVAITIAGLAILFALASVYISYSVLSFFAILPLSIALLLFNRDSKKIFFIGLAIVVALSSFYFDSNNIYKAFALIAATCLFTMSAKNNITYYVIYILIMAAPAFILGFGTIIFSSIALILYFYTEKKYPVYLLHLTLIAYASVKAFNGYTYINFIILLLICLGAFLYLKTSYSKVGRLIMFVTFIFISGKEFLKAKSLSESADKVNSIINVSPSSFFQTERPIDFVELPLRFDSPLIEKIGTSAYVLAEYLKLMVVPHPMGFYYGYAHIVPVDLSNIQSIISILLHLMLLAVSLFLIRKQPVISFGIIFYLASIAIFSNLLYPVVGMMADRFTYVASMGYCIVVGYLFYLGYNNLSVNKRKYLVVAFSALLIAYSGMTIARNAQWKNHLTLMRNDIQYLDKSAQAHNLLASNLMKYSFEKEYAKEVVDMRNEAIAHYKRAVEIYPDFFNAWYDLGRAYMIFNDLNNAYPCFLKVHEMDSTLSNATLNIAMIAEERNDIQTAIKYYERTIRINPYIKEGYANLSYLYFKANQLQASIEVNQKAIQYNNTWVEPYENIAKVYIAMGDTANAKFYVEQASRLRGK